MLVRRVIVGDGVDDLPGRDGAFDLGKEADEFLMPMAGDTSCNDLALDRIEGGGKWSAP